MEDLLVYIIATCFGACHAVIVYLTYEFVPEPYMDEIFHINQTRAYCNEDYSYWNPMITTPPALYVILPGFLCHGYERYINSMLYPVLIGGLYKLRRRFYNNTLMEENLLTVLIVSLLPVLYTTSVLYYTDLLSLTAVVVGFSCSGPQYAWIYFLIAVCTRQTNIIWAGLYVLCAMVKKFSSRKPISSLLYVVYQHVAFLFLLLGFLLFVFVNEGIVLGDRSAHQPALHIPQVFYLATFLVFSALPLFLADLKRIVQSLVSHWYLLIPLGVAVASGVQCCTMAHPYLLADNRHFTFYLWRRWFMRNEWMPLVTVPLYLAAFFFVLPRIASKHGFMVTALAVVSTAVALVPAPLLETRYYIVPYVLWRLSVRERRKGVLLAEMCLHVTVSCATLWLFFRRPFRWPHDPAALQRFMW